MDYKPILNYIYAFQIFIYCNFSTISFLIGIGLIVNNILFIRRRIQQKKDIEKNKKYYTLNISALVFLLIFFLHNQIKCYLPKSGNNSTNILKTRIPISPEPSRSPSPQDLLSFFSAKPKSNPIAKSVEPPKPKSSLFTSNPNPIVPQSVEPPKPKSSFFTSNPKPIIQQSVELPKTKPNAQFRSFFTSSEPSPTQNPLFSRTVTPPKKPLSLFSSTPTPPISQPRSVTPPKKPFSFFSSTPTPPDIKPKTKSPGLLSSFFGNNVKKPISSNSGPEFIPNPAFGLKQNIDLEPPKISNPAFGIKPSPPTVPRNAAGVGYLPPPKLEPIAQPVQPQLPPPAPQPVQAAQPEIQRIDPPPVQLPTPPVPLSQVRDGNTAPDIKVFKNPFTGLPLATGINLKNDPRFPKQQ